MRSTLNKNKAADGGEKAASRRREEAGLVDQMIKNYAAKVKEKQVTLGVGDLIRLIQFRKELETGNPKEIKATWVEPTEKEPATET